MLPKNILYIGVNLFQNKGGKFMTLIVQIQSKSKICARKTGGNRDERWGE